MVEDAARPSPSDDVSKIWAVRQALTSAELVKTRTHRVTNRKRDGLVHELGELPNQAIRLLVLDIDGHEGKPRS